MTSRARCSSTSCSTPPADSSPQAAAGRKRNVPEDSAALAQGDEGKRRLGGDADTRVGADPLAHHPRVTQEIADRRMTPPDRLRVEPIHPARALSPSHAAAEGERNAQAPVFA